VGSQAWHAQYQGVPRHAEGQRFKRSWFPVVTWPPPLMPVPVLPRVRYWDKAGTQGGQGCFTAGVLMCRTAEGLYIVEDVVRGRWGAAERDATMLRTAQADFARCGDDVSIWCEQEPGSGGKESAEATIRQLAGYGVHAERVTGSKEVRAEPFASQCEAGNVRLAAAAWNGDFLDEITGFPNGRFSDQTDAASGAFNKLAREQREWDGGLPLALGSRRQFLD
jgi:predicted phage terminase large subunit-like protein